MRDSELYLGIARTAPTAEFQTANALLAIALLLQEFLENVDV